MKQEAARSRNGVVGSNGRKMPIMPMLNEKIPAISRSLLPKGVWIFKIKFLFLTCVA